MKKLIASLLALLMLAIPAASLAQTDDYYTTATEAGRRINGVLSWDMGDVLTGDDQVDAVVRDLLESLDITYGKQGDEFDFSLGFKQADGSVSKVLTLGAAVSGNDAYINSNLLGGTIVISAQEIVPVVNRLIDLFAMIGFMTEEEAEEIKAMLPTLEEILTAEIGKAVNMTGAELDLSTYDPAPVLEVLESITAKMTSAPVTMQPRNCDQAETIVTMTVTQEEMKNFLTVLLQSFKDSPELCASIDKLLTNTGMYAFIFDGGQAASTAEMLDALINELPAAEIYEGDVTYRFYMDATGAPVAMNWTIGENDFLNYSRLTINDGVTHAVTITEGNVDMTVNVLVKDKFVSVNFAMAEDGVSHMNLQLDVTDRCAENLQAYDLVITLNLEVPGESEYVWNEDAGEWNVVSGETETVTAVLDMAMDTVFSGVDFTEKNVITFVLDGQEKFTITEECFTSDPAESIMAGDVIRPAELTDSDFANWFVGIYNGLTGWLMNVLTSLPASITTLLGD